MILSLIFFLLLYFLIRLIAGDLGVIHSGYDEIVLYFIITILYISFCTTIILNRLDNKKNSITLCQCIIFIINDKWY